MRKNGRNSLRCERDNCVCWEYNHEDYAAIACLARYAGLRIHECFRIDTAIANNTVKNMAITIKGKNGKIRTVPINESIQIELSKMLAITPRGHNRPEVTRIYLASLKDGGNDV